MTRMWLAPKGLSGAVRRWRARIVPTTKSEAGDTLLEVILAVVVISLTAAALLGAITTSIVSSSSHRNLTTDDTLLRSYGEEVQYQIEQQPSPLYQTCASSYTVAPNFTVPAGYQLAISQIQYWGNGTALTSSLNQSSPSPLSVSPLVYPIGDGDVLVIGNQTAQASAAPAGATSIAISSLSTLPNPPGSNNPTWIYDQGWFPIAACSPPELGAGALPGNDFQQLTLTVTAPTGIAEQMQIIVRNPNNVNN